jgi:hypoxanthine phosphoribosyltransferase
MDPIFGRPIITQEQIRKRIAELGRQITQDYRGKDLLMVGVLKGAFTFFSDLVRAVRLPVRIDFMTVSSRHSAEQSGRIKVISDLSEEVANQDILLVEDIVDSGLTASRLKRRLNSRRPHSLRICALLDKPSRRKVRTVIDYVGFTIPDQYVVGYGLDYKNKYRNLPYIAVLENVDAPDLSYWQEAD